MRTAPLLSTLAAVVLLLTACGDPPPADPVPGAQGAAKVVRAPGDADMVAAVTLSGADAPVKLQFAVRSRPRLNEPLELGFTLQPTRDIDSAQVTFEPNDGIEIASENPFFSVAHTAAGNGAPHKLTVVPRRAGVLSLTAVVAVDGPTGSVARSFAIPIIVLADKS